MNKWIGTLTIIGIAAASSVAEGEALTVTLPENAVVTAGDVLLGQIAQITGPEEQAEKLAAVSIGPAPLAGYQRPITIGLVSLRMRRAGWNPDEVAFAGAQKMTLTTPGYLPAQSPTAQSEIPHPRQILVRRGDAVRIVLVYKAITITATGQTLADAAQDEIVQVRMTGSRHTTYAMVTGPRTVQVKL